VPRGPHSVTDQIKAADEAAVSSDALRKAEEFIEQEEGAANRLAGWTGTIVTAIAIVCTLFHLYIAVAGSWQSGHVGTASHAKSAAR